MSNSSRPHGLQPTRLLRPCDFPGKSTGVGVPLPSLDFQLNTDFSGGRSGGLVFPSLEQFSTVCCGPHKCFGIVDIAEIDVFLELSCFLMIQSMKECNFTCLSSCSRGDSPHLELCVESAGFPDDAWGCQCPFVLCLHPQGCLRRDVRASGS